VSYEDYGVGEDKPTSAYYQPVGRAEERIAKQRLGSTGRLHPQWWGLAGLGVLLLCLLLWWAVSRVAILPVRVGGAASAALVASPAPAAPLSSPSEQPQAVATIRQVAPSAAAVGSSTNTASGAACEEQPPANPGDRLVASHAGTVKLLGSYVYVIAGCWTTVYYPLSSVQVQAWQQVTAGQRLGEGGGDYEVWHCSGSRDPRDSGTARRPCTQVVPSSR